MLFFEGLVLRECLSLGPQNLCKEHLQKPTRRLVATVQAFPESWVDVKVKQSSLQMTSRKDYPVFVSPAFPVWLFIVVESSSSDPIPPHPTSVLSHLMQLQPDSGTIKET